MESVSAKRGQARGERWHKKAKRSVETGRKVCTKCGEDKPLTAFHKDRGMVDGHKPACRLCTNEVKRAWRKVNESSVREGRRAAYERNRDSYLAYYRSDSRREKWFKWKLEKQFGITVGDFEEMMDRQCGACAICGSPPGEANGHRHKHRLHVDHCHETGVVRGCCAICVTPALACSKTTRNC